MSCWTSTKMKSDTCSKFKILQNSPVFKKGDSTNLSNYSPIALKSIACKVMEAIGIKTNY